MKIFLYFLTFLLLVYLGIAYYFSTLIIHPPRRSNAEVRQLMMTRGQIDIDTFGRYLPLPTEVSLPGVDGVTLSGSWFKQEEVHCAVIILHGIGSTRKSMMKYVPFFYECGCEVITYDQRAHGESEGKHGTGGIKEAEDLVEVTHWLNRTTNLPYERIGWVGESWGGSAVLQAGADELNVAFIMAESAFASWDAAIFERGRRQYGNWVTAMKPGVWLWVRLRAGVRGSAASALAKAPQIEEPVLLFHSRADAETASEQSVSIAGALAEENHHFHHLEWGAVHGNNVFSRPNEYYQLIETFWDDLVPNWPRRCNQ